jgi:hypothetical protein
MKTNAGGPKPDLLPAESGMMRGFAIHYEWIERPADGPARIDLVILVPFRNVNTPDRKLAEELLEIKPAGVAP